MNIRQFDPSDSPALRRIFYSAIHQLASADYSAEQIAAWAPGEIEPAKWAARMRGILPFVAEVDGEAAGYADVQADGYIDHFFVSPAAVELSQGIRGELFGFIALGPPAGCGCAARAASIERHPFFLLVAFQLDLSVVLAALKR